MNEFSGISTATLRTWLIDGQAAMQQLALGKQTVAVATADGKSIRFTPGDMDKLRSYLRRLQTAISIAEGTSSGQPWSVATWTR
jgi:hypothetical protein